MESVMNFAVIVMKYFTGRELEHIVENCKRVFKGLAASEANKEKKVLYF